MSGHTHEANAPEVCLGTSKSPPENLIHSQEFYVDHDLSVELQFCVFSLSSVSSPRFPPWESPWICGVHLHSVNSWPESPTSVPGLTLLLVTQVSSGRGSLESLSSFAHPTDGVYVLMNCNRPELILCFVSPPSLGWPSGALMASLLFVSHALCYVPWKTLGCHSSGCVLPYLDKCSTSS